MKGADYIANERLTDAIGKVLAAPGETCARVPEKSLPWLLEGGHIRSATDKKATKAKAAEPAEVKE